MMFDEYWADYTKPGSRREELRFTPNIEGAARDAWEAAQPQWRPMATAPKDDTPILIRLRNGRCAVGSVTRIFCSYPNGVYAFRDEVLLNPVAWMPLPPAPEGNP